MSLSNYLCPAQILPEAPLQMYCIYVGQTLMLTDNEKKKYFLYLQLGLQNFCYGSITAFCRMKEGSEPATHRQAKFSSGQGCHFHSHLAALSFAPSPALCRSKSLSAFCVSQRTMLLSVAYQEFLMRNYPPSKGKSLTDNVSENGMFVYSVLCQSGEGDPAAKLFFLWWLHEKGW